MRSRFSKHPSQFVDHTRRRRERTFRSATAFSRRPLGTDLSHLQDIAVLAEKVRSRSPVGSADIGTNRSPTRRRSASLNPTTSTQADAAITPAHDRVPPTWWWTGPGDAGPPPAFGDPQAASGSGEKLT